MAEDDSTKKTRRPSFRTSISAKSMDFVVIVVSLVWGGSFVGDMFIPAYDPPTGLHQIMMLLIGFIVAGRSQVGKDEKKEKGGSTDE